MTTPIAFCSMAWRTRTPTNTTTRVILHEWAHYLQGVISRDDSPGSDHTANALLDPSAAFSEGFATAFAGMVMKSLNKEPDYVDTSGPHQVADGRSIEDDSVDDTSGPGPGFLYDGFYSERSVSEVIYDLFDGFNLGDLNGAEPTVDRVSLGFKPIYDALVASKNTAAFTSLFSFLKALKDANPLAAADIDAIALAENIAAGDEYSATGKSSGLHRQGGSDHRGHQRHLHRRSTTDPQRSVRGARALHRQLATKQVTVEIPCRPRMLRDRGQVDPDWTTGTDMTVELNLKGVSPNVKEETSLIKFLEESDYSMRVSSDGKATPFSVRIEFRGVVPADCHW